METGNEGGIKESKIGKKRGWKALELDVIVRFLDSGGCGWIWAASGWQRPTSFCAAASAFHYECQGWFWDEENNSAGTWTGFMVSALPCQRSPWGAGA